MHREDGDFGNPEKDRRRKKLKRDNDHRKDKKYEKGRRRRVYIDRDEELDFGWN